MSEALDMAQVRPFIKVAQDAYIKPALGSGLYGRLQDGVKDSNLSADERLLLDDYITDALAWYTVSLLPFGLGYQIFSKGFLQKTSEESTAPSRSDLEFIERRYKSMAESYCTALISYLKANHHKYSTYLNPGSGCDVIFPESKAYTCPIYLGRRNKVDTRNASGPAPTIITLEYRASEGLSTFYLSALRSKSLLIATRAGLVKAVTELPTSDTTQLQIVNGQVTLPTGDITTENELFTFLYV